MLQISNQHINKRRVNLLHVIAVGLVVLCLALAILPGRILAMEEPLAPDIQSQTTEEDESEGLEKTESEPPPASVPTGFGQGVIRVVPVDLSTLVNFQFDSQKSGGLYIGGKYIVIFGEGGAWALTNLFFTVMMALLAILNLVRGARRNRAHADAGGWILRLIIFLSAAGIGALFVLTQKTGYAPTLFDIWTILFATVSVIGILALLIDAMRTNQQNRIFGRYRKRKARGAQ